MTYPRDPLTRRIDRLRVQVWYGWLCSLSRRATSYALEKQLVPDGFARLAEGNLSHRNRMARYAQGKHVPRTELVARADALFPGSRALLEHPYWQILDPARDATAHESTWIAGLGSDVQRILCRTDNGVVLRAGNRRSTTRALLRQLENRGSFEALAATAMLLREAQQEGDRARAFSCASSFWLLLLLVGSCTPFTGTLPAMARLADDAMLHRVVHDDEQVALSTVPIQYFERVLRHHCRANDNAGQLRPGHASWVRECLSLVRGKKGFDLFHAFSLPTVAMPALMADPIRYARFLREQTVRQKALDYCVDARWAKRSFVEDMSAFYDEADANWPALALQ